MTLTSAPGKIINEKSNVRNLVTLSLSALVHVEEALCTFTKTKVTLRAEHPLMPLASSADTHTEPMIIVLATIDLMICPSLPLTFVNFCTKCIYKQNTVLANSFSCYF